MDPVTLVVVYNNFKMVTLRFGWCWRTSQKKSTADILSQQLHRLGYMCQCIMANSCSFGVPQSRTRLYLMGIDPLQAEVTQPPERWVQLLQDTSQVIFDAVMLFF